MKKPLVTWADLPVLFLSAAKPNPLYKNLSKIQKLLCCEDIAEINLNVLTTILAASGEVSVTQGKTWERPIYEW